VKRAVPAAVALSVLVALAGVVVGAGVAESSGPAAPGKTRPSCFGKRATIVGTQKSNVIRGTRRSDVIAGLGGNDTISGLGGNDLVCGGAGADKLDGGAGSDGLDGGAGADVCRTGERTVRCEETRPELLTGLLAAGPYASTVFQPSFGFVLGAGWSMFYDPVPAQVLLVKRREPGGLALTFDSASRRQSVAATVARLVGIAGVDASPPAGAAVGGATGQRLDLTVTSGAIVRIPGLQDRYELEPTDRVRIYVVDVGGVTVTVLVEAPAGEFGAFAAEADDVLASVRWR
jgi:Ca2+-binding RTX toxin-like protein